MSNSWFQFQQFKVEQANCAMKVGTDGVLLGAWAGENGTHQKALDIGSGTGLIGLMLCQRFGCSVTAVEIAPNCFAQSQTNFLGSPWPEKFTALQADIAQLDLSATYDLIVSNPPYFDGSFLPEQTPRQLARHQSAGLNLQQLFTSASKALAPGPQARLAMVLPHSTSARAQATASQFGLRLARICEVHGHQTAPAKRVLLEWAWCDVEVEKSTLILEQSRGKRSSAYAALTRAFYLQP